MGDRPESVDRRQVHATASALAVTNVADLPQQSCEPETAQQLRNAFPNNDVPAYLLHDRDGSFAAVSATLASMNIQAVRTAPRSPWQNAYVERVIGPFDESASITSSR